MSEFKVPQKLISCADCGRDVDIGDFCPIASCDWCRHCCPFESIPCESCGGHLEGEGDPDVQEVEGKRLCVDCSPERVYEEEEEPTLHQPDDWVPDGESEPKRVKIH